MAQPKTAKTTAIDPKVFDSGFDAFDSGFEPEPTTTGSTFMSWLGDQMKAAESDPTFKQAKFVADVFKGAGKELLKHGVVGGKLLRKIPGIDKLDEIMAPLEVDLTQNTAGEMLGGLGESAAEVMGPAGLVSGAVKGLPLAVRMGAEGATSAAQSVLQGGSPLTAGVLGAMVPAAGAAISRAVPFLKAGANKAAVEATMTSPNTVARETANEVMPELLQRGELPNTMGQLNKQAGEKLAEGQAALSAAKENYIQLPMRDEIDNIRAGIDKAKEAIVSRRSLPNGKPVPQDKALFRALDDLALEAARLNPGNTSSTVLGRIKTRLGALEGMTKPVKTAVAEVSANVDKVAEGVAGTRVETKPIIDALDSLKNQFVVKAGPGFNQSVGDFGSKAVMTLDRMKEAIIKLGDDVSVESMEKFASKLPELAKAKEGTVSWAQNETKAAIMRELSKARPDVDQIAKEVSFWGRAQDLARTAVARQGLKTDSGRTEMTLDALGTMALHGGGMDLFSSAAMSAGLVRTAIVARKVLASPTWKLVDAKTKSALADAIASGNMDGATSILGKIAGVEFSRFIQ